MQRTDRDFAWIFVYGLRGSQGWYKQELKG